MVGTRIESLNERMEALANALVEFLPARHISRSFLTAEQQDPDQILDGVLMILSDGETDFDTRLGMAAREGTHAVLLVGHLKVEECKSSMPVDIELAELDLMEDIKRFVRSQVEGMSITLESLQQSRQSHYPYGWVTARLQLQNPRTTAY